MAGSHAKSLRILTPWSSSLAYLTRLSRFSMVNLVYTRALFEIHVLSGIEMMSTPSAASPEYPMKS